jgi:NADH-quinone oxidoreductase subunit J
METVVFAVAAALALASGLSVVLHRDPVYAVMSLVVTLLALAVLFVQLAGHLLAVLLILVYAGAILVLFLFVIMLLNVGREPRGPAGSRLQRWSALVGSVVFAGILATLQWSGGERRPVTEDDVGLTRLARHLFDEYLLAFEIAGLLLLAAVIAATVLARREAGGGSPTDTEEA